MADTKISALTVITALAGGDKFAVADVSGAPDSRAATIDQLRNFLTPRGYIWGLTLSNNSTDAANDIDVAAGEAMAESHDEVMTLSGTIVKRLDAAWAVGTNQGGLNTGAEAANTWYEVHLIKRTDTGVVDVMFTTTANRATLPANYDKQRRIGWIRNDGSSNILAFTQVEDYFTLTNSINDITAPVTTAATVALTVPPNTIALFRAANTTTATTNATGTVVFNETVEAEQAPDHAVGHGSLGVGDVIGTDAGHFALRVNASSQIRHDAVTTAAHTMDVSTYGWIDRRRRLAAI